MITNRSLILPYAAPYLTYVFIASAFGDLISVEANYIVRLIAVIAVLVWAWEWYCPISGPDSLLKSIITGIVAGVIGLILWILLLTPFTDSLNDEPWSTTAFMLRLFSAGLLVPVFEEILMRGFVFRLAFQWGEARREKQETPLQVALDEKSINDVPSGAWSWSSVLISSLVFASGHHFYEWPAAIVFSLLMTFLWVLRKDLIVCIVAHSVTNILLAVYVFKTNSWYLW
ncbi:MAG: CPBP family intramembrane metalloprotease [Desulfobulbaceae bacterium]|nr:CPBP family intramembrane metalloprotease [Desulfobulbaceae bacterium]